MGSIRDRGVAPRPSHILHGLIRPPDQGEQIANTVETQLEHESGQLQTPLCASLLVNFGTARRASAQLDRSPA